MKLKSFKLFVFTITNLFFVGISGNVFADNTQIQVPENNAVIPNPLGSVSDIPSFITLLLDTLFPIMSLLAVFFIIYSGFLMVTAGANEEKLSKARQAFLWTVIGVAILLGAKIISAVVCGTINQLSTTHLSCPTN